MNVHNTTHASCHHKPLRWGEKRYYALDYYLKETYGEKLYKLSLDGGFTCPNRDGTLDTRGCIFCSAGGSGDFAAPILPCVSDQIQAAKAQVQQKFRGNSYIAYFQAYTNTYGPIEKLERLFTEAIMDPCVKILSIATRPDCLGPEVLALLDRLNKLKPVWVELGLQSANEESASLIRRGYPLSVFTDGVAALRRIQIPVIAHVILGLPGETLSDMLSTVSYLNTQDIQGVKFHLLHILKHTDLADYYEMHPFFVPTLETYTFWLEQCIMHLRPDIVIHRLTGDGPKELLVAPLWSQHKRFVLNYIQKSFRLHDIWQGKEYLN